MRIISLCVDGIHQAAQRGLYDWLANQDADIICLQDLRAQEYELDGDEFQLDGYFAYIFDSGIKDTNGVAIYSREQPKALIFGLGFNSGIDMQGRYLQADFEQISIGSLLAPVISDDAKSNDIKEQFFDDLQAHLIKITGKRRDFIFCGNWGIAHSQSDVKNWQDNDTKPGFLPHEQQWMSQLFSEVGYSDAFRLGNTDNDEYSWWPSGKIAKGDGWRTDYQVISESLSSRVEYATIYKSKQFSSHLPVIIDYDLDVGTLD
jgi:exodeoxyribonuclease-3